MDFKLTKSQEVFKRTVRDFCAKELQPISSKIEKENAIPDSFLQKIGDLKLYGIPCDREYGGAGQGFTEVVLAIEEIARSSPAAALTYSVHFLPVIAIRQNANPAQKSKYLSKLATAGLGSFAFTEADTGSDPSAIRTTATLQGDHYIINGAKRFITNSSYDGPIVFFAREDDKLHAFIGEKNTPGYASQPLDLIGLRGAKVCDISLSEWSVPAENLLGNPGAGFPILVDTISVGKLNVCAMLVGASQAALEEAIKYAKEKMVRGKPIANFQTIQCLIADMVTKLETARTMVYRLASLVDEGGEIHKDSAITKLLVSEIAVEITTKAMQVQGCYSYSTDFRTGQLHRDVMIGTTVEGANELQRIIIAGSVLR
ncbi:acyl-CoA dehydrogenase family protein [Chloroflexota bacterium]